MAILSGYVSMLADTPPKSVTVRKFCGVREARLQEAYRV